MILFTMLNAHTLRRLPSRRAHRVLFMSSLDDRGPDRALSLPRGFLAAALLPRLIAGRNPQLELPSAFDPPAPGTTRLDLW